VREIERRFGRIVTYEDTSYVHPKDLVDITEQVQRHDTSKRVLVMRRGAIKMTFLPPSEEVDEWLGELLADVVAASKAAGNTGEFKVTSRPGAFHIVPVARTGISGTTEPYTSPLDVPLTLAYRDESAGEFMGRFARGLSTATGRRVTPGTFPTNLFMQRRVALSAQDENARDLLWRALQAVRGDLSWRLLCDVGGNSLCAINIHPVMQR
jgi:hypothetical protein